MGKYTKKKRKHSGILIGCLTAAAALAVALTVFLSGKEADIQETFPQAEQEQTLHTEASVEETTLTEPVQTQPPCRMLTVDSVEQEGKMMVVTTSYCVLQYPFAFSDIIRVTPENYTDYTQLQFCAYLNAAEYPIFSIAFGGSEGTLLGELTLDDGTTVAVTVLLFEADESMESDVMPSFYAAQETVNDIIDSLMNQDGFVPA